MTIYGTMICVGRIDTSYRGDVEILTMLTDKQGGKPMDKMTRIEELHREMHALYLQIENFHEEWISCYRGSCSGGFQKYDALVEALVSLASGLDDIAFDDMTKVNGDEQD